MKANRASPKKKLGFDDSFDVTKRLQQIEIPDLLNVCAQRSELPSDISTMIYDKFSFYFFSSYILLNESLQLTNSVPVAY